MYRTITTTLLFITALWITASARSDTLKQISPHHRHMYAWLLTSGDTQSVRIGGKALLNDGAVTTELADIAAKILTEHDAGARSSMDLDTVR